MGEGERTLDGERAACERCQAVQPPDWRPGELCGTCGGAVRREVRCPWCARLVPAARFCRACGVETVAETRYAAARMLRAGGVDRFALAQRVADLDAEMVRHLDGLYAAQRVVAARRCDEVRLCQAWLVGQGHAERIEEELIASLPLDEGALAALAAGPAGPFDHQPERLREIATGSPRPDTRVLAALALVRRGEADDAVVRAALAALAGADAALALEAALALAHFRTLAAPWAGRVTVDGKRMAAVASPALGDPVRRGWAAVACARAGGALPEPVTRALAEAAAAADPDLRLSAALALGNPEGVRAALATGQPAMIEVAIPFLARRGDPAIADVLERGDDHAREAALRALPRATPAELAPAVLGALEAGGPAVRRLAASKLGGVLTEPLCRRALAALLRAGDADALAMLLRARPLPDADAVVRAVLGSALPLGRLDDALGGLAGAGLVPPRLVSDFLADPGLADTRRQALLKLAERTLEHAGDAGLAAVVTRLALGPHAAALRSDACWVLLRVAKRHPAVGRFKLTLAEVTACFADAPTCARQLAAVLADDATLRQVGYFDWLTDLLRSLDAPLAQAIGHDAGGHRALVDALLGVLDGDYWIYLRSAAAEALGLLGAAGELRAHVVAELGRRLGGGLPYDIVYRIERSIRELGVSGPG